MYRVEAHPVLRIAPVEPLDGETVSVGTLWTRTRGARETASFEYDPSWLAHRDAFGLEPMLPPGRGPFHTDRPVFNALTDAAPDRWGQTLMRRSPRSMRPITRCAAISRLPSFCGARDRR